MFKTMLSDKIKNFIFAFLLILPTYYMVPHFLFIFPLLFLILFYEIDVYKVIKNIGKKNIILLITIFILMSINYYVLGYDKIDSIKQYIPYFIGYILVVFYAFFINEEVKKYLIGLIFVEALFVLLESILGINTIFTFHPDFRNDLLNMNIYSARPFGLSSGIITCSYKLFIGLLLLHSLKFKNSFFEFIEIIILWAILVNFSRSIILGTVFFIFLWSVKQENRKYLWIIISIFILNILFHFLALKSLFDLLNTDIGLFKIIVKLIIMLAYYFIESYLIFKIYLLIKNKRILFSIILFLIGVMFLFPKLGLIGSTTQDVIGRTTQDVMSYRDIIFKEAFKEVKDHPIVGNNSHKFYVYLPAYKKYEHLHNSFLEILANNGFIIFILYLILIVLNTRKNNYLFIFPIFVVSLTQYFIFWGISFVDIIFIYLLIFYKKRIKVG